MIRLPLTLSLSLILSISSLFSQQEIKVVFTPQVPVINGFVTDDVWKNASEINDLYQREPKTVEPVSEKTEFLILFDHNNIYIGIRCFLPINPFS
ncbi:MAG: hypothetical protein MUC93_14190 [Bacteroidales bacterium]|nr:hypothetical protein [Bacteroidales bacterium]